MWFNHIMIDPSNRWNYVKRHAWQWLTHFSCQLSSLEFIRTNHIFSLIFMSINLTMLYDVKVQRSLAPLSRFRGSHILTAHEQQCCRFQSYANSVRSPMWNLQAKLTLREPHSWDPRQRTTWSRVVTSDFNNVLWTLPNSQTNVWTYHFHHSGIHCTKSHVWT